MGEGWGAVNVGRQFPASFRKYFGMNRIFSVALVYCDKYPASRDSFDLPRQIGKRKETLRAASRFPIEHAPTQM